MIERRAKLNNTPPFGHDSNRGYFQGSQVNVSNVAQPDDIIDIIANLVRTLGIAGGPHIDPRDCAYALTGMIPFGDIEGCHPGFFHVLDLGMHVPLDNFSLTLFSGQHLHGGSAPRPINGNLWQKYLCRLNMILYPTNAIASFLASQALAAGTNGRTYDISNAALWAERPTIPKTPTFIRDGVMLASHSRYADHASRMLYLLSRYIALQSDSSVDLQIDPAQFISAISYLDEEGNRKTVNSWLSAPGASPEADKNRIAFGKELKECTRDVRMTMYSQLRSKDFSSYLEGLRGVVEKEEAAERELQVELDTYLEESLQLHDEDDDDVPIDVPGLTQHNVAGPSASCKFTFSILCVLLTLLPQL